MMVIIKIIKTKITAWCESNARQAEKYLETEKLITAWAFFNRGIKPRLIKALLFLKSVNVVNIEINHANKN